MRWNARGTAALLVSALVGVTAGVMVGFTTVRLRRSTPAKIASAASAAVSVGASLGFALGRYWRLPGLCSQ